MNGSIHGDLLGNRSVAMEAEDLRMVTTSYLMFKICVAAAGNYRGTGRVEDGKRTYTHILAHNST